MYQIIYNHIVLWKCTKIILHSFSNTAHVIYCSAEIFLEGTILFLLKVAVTISVSVTIEESCIIPLHNTITVATMVFFTDQGDFISNDLPFSNATVQRDIQLCCLEKYCKTRFLFLLLCGLRIKRWYLLLYTRSHFARFRYNSITCI